MDIWNREKRSKVMSKIGSKNTKPELLLRTAMHKAGFRFRLHDNTLPGKPDIVLKKYRTVVFVHGCFWHKHKECREGRIPASNSDFWTKKIANTLRRDKEHVQKLEKSGWQVIIIWECEIEKEINLAIAKIMGKVKSNSCRENLQDSSNFH